LPTAPPRLSLALTLLLPLLSDVRLPAQNALSNPELDPPFYAQGWRLSHGAELDWTGVDSDGCPSSGSGQLTSGPTDTGWQWGVASQCVTTHPAQWPYGYSAEFDYLSAGATMAYILVNADSDTLCGWGGGTYLGFDYSNGPVGPGWHHVTMDRGALPAGAESLEVGIAGEAGGAPIEILFDRAYFGGIPRVFIDGFETDQSTCRWSSTSP
jgi:hypothetical protein